MPMVLERGNQCVLIGGNGSSEDGPYVCASCGGKGDGGEGGAKLATRKEEAGPNISIKEGPTDEELEALMGDKDKIKSMERRINLLKSNQVYFFFSAYLSERVRRRSYVHTHELRIAVGCYNMCVYPRKCLCLCSDRLSLFHSASGENDCGARGAEKGGNGKGNSDCRASQSHQRAHCHH